MDICDLQTSVNACEYKMKIIAKQCETIQKISDSCKLLEVREQKLEDHIKQIEEREEAAFRLKLQGLEEKHVDNINLLEANLQEYKDKIN
jgi:hypothetical protein